MTTITPPSRPSTPPSRPGRLRPAAWDVARSEWVKLRTVRSTYWTLLVTFAAMAGFGTLLCAAYARHYSTLSSVARRGFDPAAYSFFCSTVIGEPSIQPARHMRGRTARYAIGGCRCPCLRKISDPNRRHVIRLHGRRPVGTFSL